MKGILLINLGSPKDLEDESIKEYLKEWTKQWGEDGMLAENNFSQNDFQKKKNRIDFDVILNSLGSIELRVMPLCQGEIVFSEITFRKTNIVN